MFCLIVLICRIITSITGRNVGLNVFKKERKCKFTPNSAAAGGLWSWCYLSTAIKAMVCLIVFVCLFVFVALRPMSTAMVIAGRSVHLTTLFPG